MATAEGEDGEIMRRRRRLILQNFYGAAEAEQEKQAAPDPASIDNAAFDPDRYFERLLRSQGVRRLLKTDQSMLRDIKKLDSDMKTLVYENYNKFISATDTIRDMKSNVENMEEEMQRLTANMDTITLVSDDITATLAPRRCALRAPVLFICAWGHSLSQPRWWRWLAWGRAQGEAARAERSVPTAEEGTTRRSAGYACAALVTLTPAAATFVCRVSCVVCRVSCVVCRV
jgi:hypothetical protein